MYIMAGQSPAPAPFLRVVQ